MKVSSRFNLYVIQSHCSWTICVSILFELCLDTKGNLTYPGYIILVDKIGNQSKTQFTLDYRSQNSIIDLYEGSPVSVHVEMNRFFEFKMELSLALLDKDFVGLLISHTEG